jgi:hypothetical protein
MSINAIDGPSSVGGSRRVATTPAIDSAPSTDTASDPKEKLKQLLPELEKLFQEIARLMGNSAANDSDEAAGGGSGGGSSGGGGGGCQGASGGGAKGGGGGGGAEGAGKGSGAGGGGKPAAAGGADKSRGGEAKTKEGQGGKETSIDLNNDGKTDLKVVGANAGEYAQQVQDAADKNDRFKTAMLDIAQKSPTGELKVNLKPQLADGASGLAAPGSGEVNIADSGAGKFSENTLVHEGLHTIGYHHGNLAESAEMRAEVNRIVGADEEDNAINKLDNGQEEHPDGSVH